MLFPKIKIYIATIDRCSWCEKLKTETLPLVEALKLNYSLVTDGVEIEKLGLNDLGYPAIAIFANQQKVFAEGGFLTCAELLEIINEIHETFFPGEPIE